MVALVSAMLLRPLTLALMLLTSAFALAPSATAESVGSCPGSASPFPLVPGEEVVGTDAIAGTVVADDCYYTVATPGDLTGKQLRVLVTSTANHDVFVKETVANAAPYACGSTATTATSDTCTAWWPLVASEYSIRVKRTATVESSFALTAFLEDAPASGCSNGFAVTPLVPGTPVSGSLLDIAGARCTYVLHDASFDPANPGDDVVLTSLAPEAGNFDLSVRRGLPPTGPTSSATLANQRDCNSALAGIAVDSCEAVLENGGPLYIMVRRTSGGGNYSLDGDITGSSCSLGSGYHPLENGVEVSSSTRILVGSKCLFTAATGAAEDLLTITQRTDPQTNSLVNIPAHSLTVAKDAPIGGGPVECSGTSLHLIASGFDLSAPAVCNKLLEDGQAHDWSIRVARASGTGSAAEPVVKFTLDFVAQAIPTLLNGVPQLGHVDAVETQYWKIVVPEGATTLLVQTVGDPSNQACSAGAQVNPTAALACLLLPLPALIGCALAAGYGVDCSLVTGSLYDTCFDQIGDEEACAQVEQARTDACARIDEISPGACSAVDPSSASVKLTEMDLLVRYRDGLPTAAVHDCHSKEPGGNEQCLFSALVLEVDDEIVEPSIASVNAELAKLRAVINVQRAAVDAALADLKVAVAEQRAPIDAEWAALRAAVLDLTGQDPGALPGTPAVPATPTPSNTLPDPLNANPFPGPGKYFIAVRGPSSGLLAKGGDYAIVAIHDDVRPPSVEGVQTQIDQAQGGVSDTIAGLGSLPVPIDTSALGPVLGALNERIDGAQQAIPGDLPLPGELPVPVILPQRGDGGVGDLLGGVITAAALTLRDVFAALGAPFAACNDAFAAAGLVGWETCDFAESQVGTPPTAFDACRSVFTAAGLGGWETCDFAEGQG